MSPETLLILGDLRGLARFVLLSAVALFAIGFATPAPAQVTIAQLSDTHVGEHHSPHAVDNLRRAVAMINQRHPDAVVLSGDIGESPENWQVARQILKGLKAPLYYVPGNHDVHSRDVDRYRGVFGKDYFSFQVKGVTFLVIDSQLLGNFDNYNASSPQPMPPETESESRRMLDWLKGQKKDGTIIAVQHIPAIRDGNFPPDTKPYWEINEPYRSREMDILHQLGVRHVLAGHWHNGRVFTHEGITWHVAPATSWLPWGGELGFAMQTISKDGDVKTEFVDLGTQP